VDLWVKVALHKKSGPSRANSPKSRAPVGAFLAITVTDTECKLRLSTLQLGISLGWPLRKLATEPTPNGPANEHT